MVSLPFLFEFWGRADHQLEPPGDWITWLILGGRGSGKTRSGAEWLRAQLEGATPLAPGRAHRAALVAASMEEAREVMVLGESGLLACSPPDRRPNFHKSSGKLVWPNGAEARLFSAAAPQTLRGPQFDVAWSDELAKWRLDQETWDQLQFCLRLGAVPRQVVTTTPRDRPLLRSILGAASTVSTSAPTSANAAFLPTAYLEKITAQFRDTSVGRQELGGELLAEDADALFPRLLIDTARVSAAPPLDRVVIGVDPPASSGARSDECGIVVAGRAADLFFVLADASVGQAAPARWAAAAIAAWRRFDASLIVAETNQGGEMVEEVLRRADPAAPVRAVRARAGKRARAEPVSMLYAQGRVRHVGLLPELEDQLASFGRDKKSPDRVDALVWAVTELLKPTPAAPRVRRM